MSRHKEPNNDIKLQGLVGRRRGGEEEEGRERRERNTLKSLNNGLDTRSSSDIS